MAERFSDSLRRKLDPVWEAQHRHPFVRGLGDGSLEPGPFEVWLRQDYLFLVEYARFLALGAARGDAETLKWMIAMAHGVFQQQMLLHQAYAVELGIPTEELAAGARLPATRAFADHLLRTAALGSQLELAAALLPCVWGQAEIGQRLARGPVPADGRYARWVDAYSGPGAERLARAGRDLLDRLAAGAGPVPLAAAEDAFAASSRYRWMFWEMCYRGEGWPI